METSPTPETAPELQPAPSKNAPKVVRIQRVQIGVNVLLQALVFFGIVVMLNYLSFRHYKRWDYSRDRKYELSSQTRNLLKNLKKPVKAVIFFSSAAEIAPDVNGLLREFEFASKKKFKTEVVDPFRNFTRAQELQTKYKFGANENILILDFDGKSKFVNAIDMAEMEMPDQMSMMMGSQPRIKAFKGEQAITSALLELTEGKPNKVYFLGGHGEPDLNGPDLKAFSETLKRQNIQIASLNLLNVNSIPEDARSVIICGPKYDLSELEMKLLGDFWAKNGRIFVLLNPFAQTPRLTAFLSAQGLVPQDDRVLKTGTFLQMDDAGKPQLVSGVISDRIVFVVADSRTKITKDLAGLSKPFHGATQSLRIDQTGMQMARTRVFPIVQSGEGFWGETERGTDDKQVFFDPKKDHLGPLTLAAAVERGAVEDQRVKMDSARMIVVGNAELLGNNAYRLSEGISADLTMNALNWLLDREELIGIAPKEKKTVALSLNEKQLRDIALGVMVFLPGLVAVFGLLNWWQRRS